MLRTPPADDRHGHTRGRRRGALPDLLGVLALALFALIAVVPQTALTLAARTRPVAALDPLTATRRYATRWRCTSGWTAPSAATSRA